MRKRPFILLELLIAMGLVALLMSTLMGFYSQMAWIERQGADAKKVSFETLYAQFRLTYIFTRIMDPNPNQKQKFDKEFFFYTTPPPIGSSGQALVFVYNQGIGAGPDFSNEVIGKLYVNAKKQLIFVTWPSIARNDQINPPMMKEILMEGVSDLGFSFYRPQTIASSQEPQRAAGAWTNSWALEDRTLPAIIRLSLRREEDAPPLNFSFVMPNTETPVNY